MKNTFATNEYSRLETFVAKLYVYLLPIRMISPLKFLEPYMPGCVFYTDFWLHILGLILVWKRNGWNIIVKNDESSRLAHSSFILVCILNISSLIMACVIQLSRGNHGNESAFSGIAGMCIYFFQYSMMFIYNNEVYHILGKDNLMKILRRVSVYLLCLGYLQVLVMNFGGIFVKIHDTIDIFGVLRSAASMPKLCLTGNEGASAGPIISILVMPVLWGSYLSEQKTRYLLISLLWLLPLYFTNSSTAYITFAASAVMFLLLLFRYSHTSPKLLGCILLLTLCMIVIIVFPDTLSFISPTASSKIKYLLTEKAVDMTNGSTVARSVPLVVSWNTFLKYPILGVGNGLQGYFYEEYFPSWAMHVAGSDAGVFLERSKYGISNAGCFFPGLLSGYGIIGCFFILLFIVRLNRLLSRNKEAMGAFYFVFVIASVGIIFTGLQGDFCGAYYLWFILGLPMMADCPEARPSKLHLDW